MKHGYLKKKEAKEQAQKSGIVWREFDHQSTIKVSFNILRCSYEEECEN